MYVQLLGILLLSLYSVQGFLIPPGQTEFILTNAANDGLAFSPEEVETFRIIIPQQEQRNPDYCEPYEDVIVEEHDCHIYCEVNGTIGNLIVRDPGRRKLRTCKTSTNGCLTCMRHVDNFSNSKVYGRCGTSCTCEPMDSYNQHLREKNQCLKINSTTYELMARQPIDERITRLFTVIIPPIAKRDKKECEVYESSMSREELRSTGQCRQMCKIEGKFGLIHLDGSHRVVDALPDRFPTSCQIPILHGAKLILPDFSVASFTGVCDHWGNCVPSRT